MMNQFEEMFRQSPRNKSNDPSQKPTKQGRLASFLVIVGTLFYPFMLVGVIFFALVKLIETYQIRKNHDDFDYASFIKKGTRIFMFSSFILALLNIFSFIALIPRGYFSCYLLFPFNLFDTVLTVNYQTVLALIIGGLGMMSNFLLVSSFIQNRKIESKENKIKRVKESKEYKERKENKFEVANERQNSYEAEYQKAKRENDYDKLNFLSKHVLLGEDEYGKPMTVAFEEINEMAFGAGTTGSGKTTFISQFFEHACKFSIPSLFLDGKGAKDTLEIFERIARRHKKNIKVFSDIGKVRYNPLKYGNSVMVHDRLLSLIQTESVFYTGASRVLLMSTIQLLDEFDIKRSLKSVSKYLEPDNVLKLFLKDLKHFQDYDKYEQANTDEDLSLYEQVSSKFTGLSQPRQHLFEQLFRRYEAEKDGVLYLFVNAGGLKTSLNLLLDSELGHLFDTEGDDINELDLVKLSKQNELAFVTLNGLVYNDYIKTLGDFIISDVKYMLSQRFINEEDSPFLLICDEPKSYMTMDYIDVFNKGRGAGLHAIISPQTLADIKSIDENLLDMLIGNCNTYFLGKTNHPTEVQFWSELFGTYQDLELTQMVEQQTGISDMNKSDWVAERGTKKEVFKFRIHPDDIKDLRTGEYIIYRKAKNIREVPKKVYARNPAMIS